MTHAEVEAIVTDLENFEKANNHEATSNDISHNSSYRTEFASHVDQIVNACNALGFNPWPKIKPFFETYSIAVHPEYPVFEKTLNLAYNEVKKALAGDQITDKMLFHFFDLSRRFLAIAQSIDSQIQYPVDPRYEAWKAKQALKAAPDKREIVKEPFEPPSMPIKTQNDIENAQKEMQFFWFDRAISLGALGDFCHLLLEFGMASSFIGFLPPASLSKKWKNVSLDLLPDTLPTYLELINKTYRLFLEVREVGNATERQISRMYRISWRTRVLAHEWVYQLRDSADREVQ